MRKRALVLSCFFLGSSVAAFLACSSSSTPTPSPDGGEPGDSAPPPSGDSGNPGSDAGPTPDSGGNNNGDSGPPTEGGSTEAGPDAGYTTLNFDPGGHGSPDAIYWDNAKQILYIVNDTNNQVWTYTDAAGFAKYAQVPDNPALDDAGETKLNGVTELADGTLVVTRFGYGTQGAIYTIGPDAGATTTVPNVPPNQRRIEVTVDPNTNIIYGDSFLKSGSSLAGQVNTVDLVNGTTLYVSGFGKTVGLLVQGSSVLVSDQTNNVIVAVPTDPTQLTDAGLLADGGLFPVYANVSGPDQLSAGPNGSIYTDQFLSSYDGGGPQVREIWPDGGVTVPWPNVLFTSLSDVAYDATNSRLFVVNNNGTTVRTIKIFPVSN